MIFSVQFKFTFFEEIQKILGVNFINNLRTNFSYERRFSSYFLALPKNSYQKCERITFMKLTVGVNFINVRLAKNWYESPF